MTTQHVEAGWKDAFKAHDSDMATSLTISFASSKYPWQKSTSFEPPQVAILTIIVADE